MEAFKHFYKWFYSLSDNEQQEQLSKSKLLFPFNTWDMNYYLLIDDYQLLIDIGDVANELEIINSDNVEDLEKETLVDLAWKIYE